MKRNTVNRHCARNWELGVRSKTTVDKIQIFMKLMGRKARGPGRIYFTGGTSAILHGWRDATMDVDLKLDPEPKGAFEALAQIKKDLNINIELASPGDFIPELPGWQDRSHFIDSYGLVQFFHYDFYSQALSKIERGHSQDTHDVKAMFDEGYVKPEELMRLFLLIEAKLIRFPSIDPESFRARVEEVIEDMSNESEES